MLSLLVVDSNIGAEGLTISEKRGFCVIGFKQRSRRSFKKVKDVVFALGGFKERCRWIYKK
jgi:hypothetical protein